jgi:hypothetical protein
MNRRQSMGKVLWRRKLRASFLLIHQTYIARIIVLCCLTLLLSACTAVAVSNPFAVPAKSGNGTVSITPTTFETAVSSTPTPVPPVITLQVVNCPSTLNINWDALVGTHAQINKVQKVICGSLEGYGSLQALVNVRYYAPGARLDFYVYTNLYGTPAQQFKAQGLLDGDAQSSPTGTIITAEIGPNGLENAAPNVFKEYQWEGSAFAQVYFPGIYPDMTHYQAEQTQAQVSSGYDTSKDSAYSSVTEFALHVLHWPQITNKTITYDSRHGIYIVECENIGPGGGGFYAHLFRLDNVLTNIFEISQITPLDSNIQLSNPLPGAQVSSPAQIKGTSLATGQILGQSVLYDDQYTIVGNSGAINSTVSSGYTPFSSSVPFKLSEESGLQEGVVIFYSTNQNTTQFSNQVVVVKVFFAG